MFTPSSQVKVLWYHTSTQSLDKSSYWKLGFYLIGSRGIICNQLQMISHCVNKACSSLNWKVKIVNQLNSDWKGRSDLLADNNNLMSGASTSHTFFKGLCRGTISHYCTLTCEDGFLKKWYINHLVKVLRWTVWHSIERSHVTTHYEKLRNIKKKSKLNLRPSQRTLKNFYRPYLFKC